jgi:hypothetical protein
MVVLLIVMLAGGVLAFLRLDIKAFPDPVPASAGKCGARSAAACVPITVVLLGVLPLVQFGTAADALPAAVSRGNRRAGAGAKAVAVAAERQATTAGCLPPDGRAADARRPVGLGCRINGSSSKLSRQQTVAQRVFDGGHDDCRHGDGRSHADRGR